MNTTADFTALLKQRPACKPSVIGAPVNEKHENNENSPDTAADISCISSFSYGSAKPPMLPDSALHGPVG